MIKNNLKLSKTAWKIYYLLEKREKQQDEQGTFCIYPVKELSEQLHKGELTIKRALNELEEQKVIFRERQWGTDGQTAQKIYFHLKNQSITFEQSEFSGEETVLKNDTLTNQSQMNQSIIFEQSKFSGEEIVLKSASPEAKEIFTGDSFEQSKFSDEEIVLKSVSPEAKEIFTGDSFEQSKFSDEEIVLKNDTLTNQSQMNQSIIFEQSEFSGEEAVLKNVTPEPENEIQVIPNEVEVIPNSQ
ncbi:MAG: hypothetical protein IIT39_14080, partial [Clostridia bacterium]|nr:hypothetical protein [Clostridia bacterium]